MKSKSKKIVGRFWKMYLCMSTPIGSLTTTIGKDRCVNDWFNSEAKIIKRDKYSRVGFVQEENIGKIYIKHYSAKSWWHRISMFFNQGRAGRSFKVSDELLRNGISVPIPYALITANGSFGLPDSSYYLCQGLVKGKDFKSFYLSSDVKNSDLIKDRLQYIGRQLAGLHNCGYVHGDFKWSNIIFQGSKLFFVDLDNTSKINSLDIEAKDLARFILNAEELMTDKTVFNYFMKAYRKSRKNASINLMLRCKKDLEKLRNKHLVRYGNRGWRLID